MVELEVGLIADNASVDVLGKLSVNGEFRYISAASVPASHPHFAVVARWLAETVEVRDGPHTLVVELVDEDGHLIIPRSPEIPLRFTPVGLMYRDKSHIQMILNFDNIVLPRFGTYAVHFLINGEHVGSVPFYLANSSVQGGQNATE